MRIKPKLIQPNPPRIKKKELHKLTVVEFKDEDYYEEFEMEDVDASDRKLQNLRLSSGIADHLRLENTKMNQPHVIDVLFSHSNFSNSEWEKSYVARMEIANSKLTGFGSIEGKWTDVSVKESKADLARFSVSKLKNIRFYECVLTDADFIDCEMENVVFYKCDLAGVNFSGAKLKSIDLRGSKIEKIKINPDQFKGLIVEPFQASYLMGATGAKVDWLEELSD